LEKKIGKLKKKKVILEKKKEKKEKMQKLEKKMQKKRGRNALWITVVIHSTLCVEE